MIPDDRSPLVILLLLFACLIVGYFIAAFLSAIIIIPFIDSISEIELLLFEPKPEDWWPIMIMQMVTAITLFILTPFVFIKWILKTSNKFIFTPNHKLLIGAAGITAIITICFMGFNSILVEWNSNMILPEFMSGIEDYIRSKEDQLSGLTTFLTDFTSSDKYIFTLFVIAIIPAIGEEYLFRGVIQTVFEKYLKNPHVAIIITAILFSAFHIQFYGFLPRAALGVLFGYLFYYSGNLIYPIIAHFINNGLTLTMVYLYNINAINYDIEKTETPSLLIISVFLIIGLFLMFAFKKMFKKELRHD